jgi:hypothetical protein
MPLPIAEIYEAEITSSCLVAALEGLGMTPAAKPVAGQIAVVIKIARQLSELVDRISDAARQEDNGAS